MWLQTAPGEHFLERLLAREVSKRLALQLSVGRISGSIISGIQLERVALYDAQGRLAARADALSARYRLVPLIRRHELDELAVARPVIVRAASLYARSMVARWPGSTFWIAWCAASIAWSLSP